MTAMSAKVDETNQWFDTPMPGRLNDVFGIRTEEFNRPSTPPEFSLNGKTEPTTIGFYEVLEPKDCPDNGYVHEHPGEVAGHHGQ